MASPLASKHLFALIFLSVLVGCSSSGNKPKPAALTSLAPVLSAQQVWVNRVGEGGALTVSAQTGSVVIASRNGTLAAVETLNGADLWRANLAEPLSAGVGSDGHLAAVVTQQNELVALVAGKVVWRQRLPFATFTAPLVAGQRVFVLGADRSVSGFDGNTGARLWTQTRTGEALVLRQPGVLMPVGDTLLAGLGQRFVSFNPNTGSVRWDVALATLRGANEIERMIDLVGPADRLGDTVCARAFQSAVGCINAATGQLKWSQPADGRWGVKGDDKQLFGTEANGNVVAYERNTGSKIWSTSLLAHRDLSAPLVLGRSVVVGDGMGYVHLLSREDGSPMGRLTTDGSAIETAPVVVGDTLMVLTQKGNLFAWRPQ